MSLKIQCIPILRDNYCWLIGHAEQNSVYVIDPGEAAPVAEYLQKHSLKVKAILLTHKHPDHTQGVDFLKQQYTAPVAGPQGQGYSDIEIILCGGEIISLWDNVPLTVKATPGHTTDHVCYWLKNVPNSVPHVFCGDTLFSAGCGRLLGGTAAQLFESLRWIKQLPDNTQLYPTHEYTLANLAFANRVNPSNPHVTAKLKQVEKLRVNQTPSLPSTVEMEKQINPFLRCHEPEIKYEVEKHFGKILSTELECFTLLRQWKDDF